MRAVIKWIGIGVASLAGLIVIVGLALYVRGRQIAASGPPLDADPLAVQPDTALCDRGRHLTQAVAACETCHGPGLGGKPFGMPALLVSMAAPNLTRGRGGVGVAYTLADWDRAIRHGVARDGRQLVIMPSDAYTHLSDADFAAVVSYLTSLPPVDSVLPPRHIGPVGGMLIGAGALPLASTLARRETHDGSESPADSGRYLVSVAGCALCHGLDFAGRSGKGGPPPAPSLVGAASMRTVDDFRATLRTGRTPNGRALDPELMPWGYYSRMDDAELAAIWQYLHSTTSSPSRSSE